MLGKCWKRGTMLCHFSQFNSAQWKSLILILSMSCCCRILLLISYINVHISNISKTAGGEEWGKGDNIIAESSYFSVWVSPCARSLLLAYCSFCSTLKSRLQKNNLESTSQLFESVWMSFYLFQTKGILESDTFFSWLAPYSHLDEKRCNQNEVKVLTSCENYDFFFTAKKDQMWL